MLAALAMFGTITAQFVVEPAPIESIDLRLFHAVVEQRRPWLDFLAVVITQLGSITVVVLLAVAGVVLAIRRPDRRAAAQLALAAVGSMLWEALLKVLIGRQRPSSVDHLVEVSTLSYPSGHSTSAAALYITFALIAAQHFRRPGIHVALLLTTAVIVAAVGLSRMYLGVHYPSDVLSGVLLGSAWALLLAALLLPRA